MNHFLSRQLGHNFLAVLAYLFIGMLTATYAGSVFAINVSPQSVSIRVGATATVSVSKARGGVTVSSSAPAVATVTYASGIATIRGVSPGTAAVTIADRRDQKQVSVTVTPALTVSPTSVQVPVGGTAAVSVTNATGTVTATSSNTSIATVTYASGTATIRGVAVGSATVTIANSLASRQVAVTVVAATAANYTLLAWNNIGMHCVDGVDYSIFSILPPLNTVNAQLVNKATGQRTSTGVTLTYQATADTNGSINTISSTKTNFWQYVQSLFGLSPAPDVGLLGYPMATNTPAPMAFNAAENWFEAVGIPIVPYDDTHRFNAYPMIQIVARNTAGQTLATTKVVLPVSDEMTCKACHSSTNSTNAATIAAKPAAGWVFDPEPLRDWKKNILRLHDEKQAGKAVFTNALASAGYPNGLYNSATSGKPVLCVACHVSNAYQIEAGVPTGITGISALTRALHNGHAPAVDPATGLTLNDNNNRSACYSCHPGSVTKCLRGAMSTSNDIQCQSCHSNMTHVGAATRSGWLTEPNCQACHSNSLRRLSAVDANGNLLGTTDQRFATTPNVPSAGFSLYRFSSGHGGMKCSACHGSTHAEFPSTDANDNVQSIGTQGYAGTVTECSSCHTTVPTNPTGGPHGMHPVGQAWVKDHHDQINASGGVNSCTYCHGADFRGSPMSTIKTAKTFSHDSSRYSYIAGQQVSCYDCHNGPQGGGLALQNAKMQVAAKGAAGSSGLNALGFMAELGSRIMAWVRELSLQA